MLDEVETLINERSNSFINTYFKDTEFIDLLEKETSSDWLFLMYKNKDSKRIQVACLVKKGTDREPCFFGSLSYYVWMLAMDAFEDGYKQKYSDKVYMKRKEIEKEFVEKYGLDKRYFFQTD